MEQVPLLLVTSRLAIRSLFESPPERDTLAFAVVHLPAEQEAVERTIPRMEPVAVAVVDFTPNRSLAIRACRLLSERAPAVPVLALACCPQTLTDRDLDVLADCGTHGLIDLSEARPGIMRAVGHVLRGEVVIQVGAIAESAAVLRRLGPAQRRERSQLTSRERAVLQRLVDGLSHEEIAEVEHVAVRTVNRRLHRPVFRRQFVRRVGASRLRTER